MVHVEGHGVRLSLVVVELELMGGECVPGVGVDDDVVAGEDAGGDIEDVGIGLDEPLDPLLMCDLAVVVLGGVVLHHVEEVFEEGEAVVEVDAFVRAQVELRDQLVAVGMEHPQMVHDVLQVTHSRRTPVVLLLVVPAVRVPAEYHLSCQVQAHEGPQNAAGG